jgi:hypothetical protein
MSKDDPQTYTARGPEGETVVVLSPKKAIGLETLLMEFRNLSDGKTGSYWSNLRTTAKDIQLDMLRSKD